MRFLAFLVLIFSFTSASQSIAADVPELVIYTYDSMVAEGGLGPKIFPAFEKQCGCKLIVRASGDGEQIIGRLQLDDQRKKPTAHVVLGLDESTFDRAKPWLDLEFRLKKSRPLAIDRKFSGAFVPYDYGYFTFIADQETLKKAALVAPSKFSDLLKP